MQARIAFVMAIVALLSISSCKKSALNPCCWGKLEDALLVVPGPTICVPYIILKSTGERYVINNDIPKEFKEQVGDSIPVKVKYKLVEGSVRVPPCGTEKEAKVLCIKKR
ncbi:MAG: hypothetical protein GXO48_01980 [Chlorobi bacterium]|nr:hypothetical protein [Chlorobiota bacterium]